jgi:hypothetical protein
MTGKVGMNGGQEWRAETAGTHGGQEQQELRLIDGPG